MSIMFFIIFLALMILGLPVLFALAAAPLIEVMMAGQVNMVSSIFNRINISLESFTLLALPFFILAGAVMGKGRITEKIIGFSQVMVGHVKGSLGHVVILSATLFSALTGSAVAATSAIGNMLIPEMYKNGFTKKYAAAVTAAATVLGPIIPPSGIMIIYAFTMNVSVGAMFIASIIPGLLFCVSLMIVNYILCSKKGFNFRRPKATFKERVVQTKHSFLALLTPVIILGGIYGGIFTPTESASVAVAYGLIIALLVYRSIPLKALFPLFRDAAISSSSILLMVAFATGFAVVASEIRALAQNVNEAAGNITNIIEKTVAKIEIGDESVKSSLAILLEIEKSAKEVSDILVNIYEAASEEEDSVRQINVAMNELNEITQENSELANKSSILGKEIVDGANNLSSELEYFKVNTDD